MEGLLAQVLAQMAGFPGNNSIPASNAANVTAVQALAAAGAISPGLQPSGDTTGVTDTANAQGLLNLASPGSRVPLGAGIFYTKAPLTVPPYVVLQGQRGAVAAADLQPTGANYGTVIRPVSAWASALPVAGAISLLDCQSGGYTSPPTPNTGVNPGVHIRDILIDGTTSPSGVDGIAAYGSVEAVRLDSVGIYAVTGNGISGKTNPSSTAANKSPDGWHASNVIIQAPGLGGWGGAAGVGDGISQDSTLIDVHVQGAVGGDAFGILADNCTLIGCRADYSGFVGAVPTGLWNGYTINVFNATGINSAIKLIGCNTDSNCANGLNIINSSATGTSSRVPVITSGCHFHADGVNGGSGGGGYAGVLVSGRSTLLASGCEVSVDTVNVASGSPQYGLATASSGSGPGRPVWIGWSGGLLNGVTAPVNDAAPAAQRHISGDTAILTGIFGSTLTPYKAAPFVSKPGGPAGTVSATLVMMGLGTTWAYTPTGSGIVAVTLTGLVTTATAVATATYGGRYGTGTAPGNGVAVTGTRFGAAGDPAVRPQTAGTGVPWALTDMLTLTPGTTYWFDLALDSSIGADSASFTDLSIILAEQ
jgi:hypothetical protein